MPGWREFAGAAILQVTCVAVLIASLFFTAGIPIERRVLREQASYVVGQAVSTTRMVVPAAALDRIRPVPERPSAQGRAADVRAAARNRTTLGRAIAAASVCCTVGCALGVLVTGTSGLPQIVPELLATAAVVVVVELTFAGVFAAQHLYLDPARIALVALAELAS